MKSTPEGLPVTAEEFGLKGPRGRVFHDVGFTAAPGALVAVEGRSGSGRTCLLLALTGRMRPTSGRARIGEYELPRRMAAVRRITALGPAPGVNDLDPALTVEEHIRERLLYQRRFGESVTALLRRDGSRPGRERARLERALELAGLVPDSLERGLRTSVRDLDRLEALRLGTALALTGRPGLLAVDDVDHKLSGADRAQAWRMLRGVASSGVTVLAACAHAPEDADVTVRPGSGPADGDDGDTDDSDSNGNGNGTDEKEGTADADA
ncbi:ATP-binding cassette domain-containing protein [Streptomyces sp. SCUT-3]|uniref:ATP-binding cassette domain-containing protein n=1 Tax=Streptomyces sp. SCUT-3 TaxID=2684469 RepID=UPI000CC10103|nr:ATP-binding cassette domain-containing protein [Streptomyces sp. SCUT-3]PLW65641.1 ABC transporter ATP-binding protein [Streptomyces sp. DJ]QMV23808.1 ATP-binding cassette domain-containing protein [Streptomyces sp. SCUT-3]